MNATFIGVSKLSRRNTVYNGRVKVVRKSRLVKARHVSQLNEKALSGTSVVVAHGTPNPRSTSRRQKESPRNDGQGKEEIGKAEAQEQTAFGMMKLVLCLSARTCQGAAEFYGTVRGNS